MARVTVHVSVGIWGSTVTEQMHNLMDSLLVITKIIPEHCGILKVRLWVPLLGVDEEGEL